MPRLALTLRASMTAWGPQHLSSARLTQSWGQSLRVTPTTSNPCSIAQAAAAAALGGPQQFLDDRNAAFKKRRDMVVAMLNDAPGLNCPTPDGAFYVYPDASGCIGKTTPDGKLIDSDEALIDYFLDTARVAAVHGAAFGLSPAFRVSYATSEAVLKEACIRIQQACAALR